MTFHGGRLATGDHTGANNIGKRLPYFLDTGRHRLSGPRWSFPNPPRRFGAGGHHRKNPGAAGNPRSLTSSLAASAANSPALVKGAGVFMGGVFAIALLAGCASPRARDLSGEMADQSAHAALGYAMARELSRWTDDDTGIEMLVMSYAQGREALQHDDGRCGDGCQRDLAYWRVGVQRALGER